MITLPLSQRFLRRFPLGGVLLALCAVSVFLVLLFTSLDPPSFNLRIVRGMVLGAGLTLAELALLRILPGEPRGVFSNVYGLVIVSGITISLPFLHLDPFWLALSAGFVLALNAALWGDFFVQGHYDDWLWVLSDRHIVALRHRVGSHLLAVVTLYFLWVTGAYVFAFFSLRTWLVTGNSLSGLPEVQTLFQVQALINPLGQIGLVILLVVMIWFTANMIVAIRKYRLLTSAGKIPIFTGSLALLRDKFFGKGNSASCRSSYSFNYLIKQVQRDQVTWILVLTVAIAFFETLVFLAFKTRDQIFYVYFFIIPFAISLLFGIIGHTNSSEMGGVFGVLASALIAWVISLFIPGYRWDAQLFFLIFSSALASWVIGLFSGIFAKGILRMSMLVFVLKVESPPDHSLTPALLQDIKESLEKGYQQAAYQCFGEYARREAPVLKTGTGVALQTSSGVLLGDEQFHWNISYRQRPFLQQLFYTLCANRLDAAGRMPGESRMKPVFPEFFYHPGFAPAGSVDFVRESSGNYLATLWDRGQKVCLPGFLPPSTGSSSGESGYFVTASSVVDHGLTLSRDIKTDLFCAIEEKGKQPDELPVLWIVGFSRGCTSTKSYGTLEGEIFASTLAAEICKRLKFSGLKVIKEHRARLYFPRLSIFDYGYDPDEISPSKDCVGIQSVGLPHSVRSQIQKYLLELPERNSLTTLTQNYRSRFLIWAVEVGVTFLAAGGRLNGVLKEIIDSLLDTLSK